MSMVRNKRGLVVVRLAAMIMVLLMLGTSAWAFQCCYPCFYGSQVINNQCQYPALDICYLDPLLAFCATTIQYYDLCGNIWLTTYYGCEL